jgi:hypothetical protein
MKNKIKIYSKVTATMVLLGAIFTSSLFQSCDKSDSGGGLPVVNYVRIPAAASADSLITHAFMGNSIAIMGQNLQNVNEIWFNDKSAFINSSFVTSSSIIVTIPSEIPGVVTGKMLLITTSHDTVPYSFGVDVPAPKLDALYCEYVKEGETAIVQGNYFIDDPSSPLKVIFPGNVEGTVTDVTLNEVKVTVPAGAGAGPIQVKTIYGSSRSSFYFRDDRNIILNYDDLDNKGGEWRKGTKRNDEYSLDKNYMMLKGTLTDGQETEDYAGGGFVSEFWANSSGNNRPEKNFFTGPAADYLLKFELYSKKWTGAYLEICFGPWASDAGGFQNGLYWSNINARGIYKPWEATGTFTTNGWMTVTIPMSEIKYARDLSTIAFDATKAGSMTFWVAGPAFTKDGTSDVEIYIDNVRIVPKK